MNKSIFSGLVGSAVLGGLLMATPVMANEGTAMLKGAGVSGACFATSVFVDGTYRILATCRDLKMALSPEANHYVVWATTEAGKQRRLGEIENGKLATATDVRFTDLFVTAETDAYATKPSDSILLTGMVQPIDFGPGVSQVTPSPTPTPKFTATPTQTESADGTTVQAVPNQGIGGALSTVLKIALFGFGALLLIVGVFSFISRKRSL
jgi:hypothetical protein